MCKNGNSNDEKKNHVTGEFLKTIKSYKMSKAKKIGKKIEKYDLNGKLIETYADRQECIEKNHITKSALSKHLSGKRKKLCGHVYKEVD